MTGTPHGSEGPGPRTSIHDPQGDLYALIICTVCLLLLAGFGLFVWWMA